MLAINRPARAVKIMARVVGSNNKVAITRIANESRITSITGGSPSRYMAKIKELYTKARPNSCCMMDKTAGRAIIIPAMI